MSILVVQMDRNTFDCLTPVQYPLDANTMRLIIEVIYGPLGD